jgi:hypothetical protein
MIFQAGEKGTPATVRRAERPPRGVCDYECNARSAEADAPAESGLRSVAIERARQQAGPFRPPAHDVPEAYPSAQGRSEHRDIVFIGWGRSD